jgi:hypothetical protein
MKKISVEINNEWIDYSHKPEFVEQANRLIIGLPNDSISIITGLINLISEPVSILYVLHTPRGEAKEGRYQSQYLSKNEVINFIEEYSEFLVADSRFDIWFHSETDSSTIVWDRHNMVFTYGDVSIYEKFLLKNGFTSGKPDMEFSHQHHYYSEFDNNAKEIFNELNWSYSPLKKEDIQ